MHPHRRMRQDSHLSLWTIVLYWKKKNMGYVAVNREDNL